MTHKGLTRNETPQIVKHTDPPFGKHATDSMLNDSFRNSLLQLIESLHFHPTWSAGVPPVKFLGPLLPRYSNLLSINLLVFK